MGRRLSEYGTMVRQMFEINKINSTCKICGRVIPGYHSGNLARHIQRKHPDVVTEEQILAPKPSRSVTILEIKRERAEQDQFAVNDYIEYRIASPTASPPPLKKVRMANHHREIIPPAMSPVKQRPKSVTYEEVEDNTALQHTIEPSPSSLSLPLSPDELLQSYFNMIVIDGLPLTFLQGPASSKLFSALNSSVGLQCHDVEPARLTEMILERARAEKEALIEELQLVRGVSLLLELNVTHSTHAVFVQFIKSGAIVRRLLGVLSDNQTSSKVNMVDALCRAFKISTSAVYTVMMSGNSDQELEVSSLPNTMILPCLATKFTNCITDTLLSEFKPLFHKLRFSLDRSSATTIETLSEQMNELEGKVRSSKTQFQLNAEELKTLGDIAGCLKKAAVVHDKITSNGSCEVVTDVVAAVFKFWIQLGKQSGAASKVFAQNVKTKFCNELSNIEPVNAAIFLDPRIQQLLSPADKTAAKEFLKKVHLQMSVGECADEVETEIVAEEDPLRSDEVENSEDEDDLTMFLKKKTESLGPEVQSTKIERLLQDFTDVPLLSARTSLLGYWDNPERDGTLKSLAMLVHAIPATRRTYFDANYARQVRANDGWHEEDLQDAIFFIGGNLRLTVDS